MTDILAKMAKNTEEVSKEYIVLFPDGGQWGSVAYRPFAEDFLANGDVRTEWDDELEQEIPVSERYAPEGSVIVERTVTRSTWRISPAE